MHLSEAEVGAKVFEPIQWGELGKSGVPSRLEENILTGISSENVYSLLSQKKWKITKFASPSKLKFFFAPPSHFRKLTPLNPFLKKGETTTCKY